MERRKLKQTVEITVMQPHSLSSIFRGRGKFSNNKGRISDAIMKDWGKLIINPQPSDRPFTFSFSNYNPVLRHVYEWEVDENNNPINEKDRNEQDVLLFLKQHELIKLKHGENSNCIMPIFQLEVMEDRTTEKINTFSKRLRVGIHINDMSDSERREILYYYNVPCKDYTEREVLVALVDDDSGLAWKKENLDDFIMRFIDGKDMTLSDKLYIKKAISLGIIEWNGGKYTLRTGEAVGMNEDELYFYLVKNEPLFNSIKSEVSRRNAELGISEFNKEKPSAFNNNASIEEKKSVMKDAKIRGASSIFTEETATKRTEEALVKSEARDLESLKAKAKEVGLQGGHLYKDSEKLREAIEKHQRENQA